MSQWPHDDTRSLTAFYGAPNTPSNMVLVVPPWPMTYEGRSVRGVRIHRKCADSLKAVFDDIAAQVNHDWTKLPPGAVKFSGSFNPRPVRGSSRPSCHAFGAALDMDAEGNSMNYTGDKGTMSPIVIDAFKRQGWYWGGDFHSRQDPMHFQAANETSQVASLLSDLSPVSEAMADETPPIADDSELEASQKPQATIEDIPSTAPDDAGMKHPTKSVTNWTQALLASVGIGTAGSQVDPSTVVPALQHMFHNTTFWLGLVIAALAGYTIWRRIQDWKTQ